MIEYNYVNNEKILVSNDSAIYNNYTWSNRFIK